MNNRYAVNDDGEIVTYVRGADGWHQVGGNPGGLRDCGHLHRTYAAAERCHPTAATDDNVPSHASALVFARLLPADADTESPPLTTGLHKRKGERS